MRSLNNNTLEDIAKYNDKTFKLFNYLSKSDQPLMVSELAKIPQTPDTIELLEAFRKDVTGTVNLLDKAHALLSTVDDKDRVAQLKGETRDLKEAFGEDYNSEMKTIKMGDIVLPLKQVLSKNDIKEIVIKTILGISIDDFEALFKNRKSIYSLDGTSLTNDDERIEFLSIVKAQKDYENVIEKIEGLHNSFISLRAGFSEEEKQKIDREITFSRSMIDSVTKQSTYLTKNTGIIQVANDHKDQSDLLNTIHKKVKKSPYIKAIELDKDTSLENVVQVLDQLSEINLGLAREVVFKVRKLGNYNTDGLYIDSQNIVSVDISHPSSMIHEFTHAIDFSNDMLHHTVDGQNLIKRFKYKVKRSNLPLGKQNFYLRDDEVMARLGEVAYLFDKYKIQEDEDINLFIERVKNESEEDETILSMVHSIDFYVLDKNKDVYFNLESWSKEDISLCQAFYAGLFNADNKPLKKINSVPVFQEPAKVVERAERKKYEKKSVSLINKDNIQFLMDYNEKHKVVSFEKLIQEIMYNTVHLSRTTKAYNRHKFNDQKATMDAFSLWLEEKENPYLNYQVYKNYINLFASESFQKDMLFYQAIKGDKQNLFDGEAWIKEEASKYQALRKKLDELRLGRNFQKMQEIMQQMRIVNNESLVKTNNTLLSLYPGFEDLKIKKRNAFMIDKNSKRLANSEQYRLVSKTIDVVYEYMEKYGMDNVLAFDSKQDNIVENILNFSNLSYNSVFKNDTFKHALLFRDDRQNDNLRSVIKYHNLLEDCVNSEPLESVLKAAVRVNNVRSYYLIKEVKDFSLLNCYVRLLPEQKISENSVSDLKKSIAQAPDKTQEYDALKKQYNIDNQDSEIDELLELTQMMQAKSSKNKAKI